MGVLPLMWLASRIPDPEDHPPQRRHSSERENVMYRTVGLGWFSEAGAFPYVYSEVGNTARHLHKCGRMRIATHLWKVSHAGS